MNKIFKIVFSIFLWEAFTLGAFSILSDSYAGEFEKKSLPLESDTSYETWLSKKYESRIKEIMRPIIGEHRVSPAVTIKVRFLDGAPPIVERAKVIFAVDGKQDRPLDGSSPVFVERSDKELAELSQIVKEVFNTSNVRVETVHRLLPLPQEIAEQIKAERREQREYLTDITISACIGLFFVLLFRFFIKPMAMRNININVEYDQQKLAK